MEINLIGFDVTLGKKKPENIIHQENACPFCDREHLTDILDTDGDIILLKNKYNVLDDADQFVIIEGKECHMDIPDYSLEYMHRLMRFSIRHWQSMMSSGKYKSVIFFKNYGPLSGGTLRHPHMQLIGFSKLDDQLLCDSSEFIGIPITESNGVIFNISTHPRVGFCEFNVVPASNKSIDITADYIWIAVDYIMRHFNRRCKSYNIFFYCDNGLMRVKIMPRFATSPLFIGYNIHFRPNNLEAIVKDVRKIYFADRPSL